MCMETQGREREIGTGRMRVSHPGGKQAADGEGRSALKRLAYVTINDRS